MLNFKLNLLFLCSLSLSCLLVIKTEDYEKPLYSEEIGSKIKSESTHLNYQTSSSLKEDRIFLHLNIKQEKLTEKIKEFQVKYEKGKRVFDDDGNILKLSLSSGDEWKKVSISTYIAQLWIRSIFIFPLVIAVGDWLSLPFRAYGKKEYTKNQERVSVDRSESDWNDETAFLVCGDLKLKLKNGTASLTFKELEKIGVSLSIKCKLESKKEKIELVEFGMPYDYTNKYQIAFYSNKPRMLLLEILFRMEASCRHETDNIFPEYEDKVEKCMLDALNEISLLLPKHDPVSRPIFDLIVELKRNKTSSEAYEYYLKTEILREKIEAAAISGLAEIKK